MHDIIGARFVISKQWNYDEERLNFSTDALHIMLFLAQN